MTKTIALTYTEDPALNTAADAIAFPPPSQWAIWRDRIIYGLAGLLIMLFFETILGIQLTIRDGVAAFVCVMLTSFVVVPAVFKAKRKGAIERERDGPTVLTVTAEGFQAGSNFGHFFVKWREDVRVFKLDFGLCIAWDTVTLAIPQSAYPADLTTDDLFSQITDWHSGAVETR